MRQKYSAVIKRDSGWWIGWGREVPGINGQGNVRAELLKNLRLTRTQAGEFNHADARKAVDNDYEEAAILV